MVSARSSVRCRVTTGSSLPACGASLATGWHIRGKSCCLWAANSGSSLNGILMTVWTGTWSSSIRCIRRCWRTPGRSTNSIVRTRPFGRWTLTGMALSGLTATIMSTVSYPLCARPMTAMISLWQSAISRRRSIRAIASVCRARGPIMRCSTAMRNALAVRAWKMAVTLLPRMFPGMIRHSRWC